MTSEERQLLASIEVNLAELVEWKNTVNDLLYGTLRGDFGYFHKANIIWRLLILWPLMLGSIIFGALMTFMVQHILQK